MLHTAPIRGVSHQIAGPKTAPCRPGATIARPVDSESTRTRFDDSCADSLGLRNSRAAPGTPIAQVEMLSLLLHAEQLKPRRTIRHKLHPLHEGRSNCIRLAAGDLRRHRHKEFVHNFRRQKLSKQCGPTFVEEHSYPKLQVQQSQDRQRVDAAVARIYSVYLNRA